MRELLQIGKRDFKQYVQLRNEDMRPWLREQATHVSGHSENNRLTYDSTHISEAHVVWLVDSPQADGGTAGVSGRWAGLAEGGDLGAAAAPCKQWECWGGKGQLSSLASQVSVPFAQGHILHGSLKLTWRIHRLSFGFCVFWAAASSPFGPSSEILRPR